MEQRTQSSYPLLRKFREFYCEVTRLRRMALDAIDPPPTSANTVTSNR